MTDTCEICSFEKARRLAHVGHKRGPSTVRGVLLRYKLVLCCFVAQLGQLPDTLRLLPTRLPRLPFTTTNGYRQPHVHPS